MLGMCGGLALKNQRDIDSAVLPTGIANLDVILSGGLVSGTLLELIGPTASGKTLLANSILIHFVRTHRLPVYYIDTKNACSASQLYRLMKAGIGRVDQQSHTCKPQQENTDIAEAMSLIRCEQVRALADLTTLLRSLLTEADEHESYQLLFVNSLSALLLPFQGAPHKSGLLMMAETLALLQKLSIVHRKIVLLETLSLNDLNHKPADMIRIVKHTSEPIQSTISRYWPSYPTIRLFVFKHRAREHEVILLKSTQHRSGRHVSCLLELGT